jgi:RND family efflux transporter MFP subunit
MNRPLMSTLAALGVSLAACQEATEAPKPLRPVETVVARRMVQADNEFAGVISPRYTVDRAFLVLGRVITRDVNVGDVVRAGQRLAQSDPTALALAVVSAEATLASAQSQQERAVAARGRIETLFNNRISSQSELDQAEQSQKAAIASVEQAQAGLAKAREQLSYATLRADADGVVTAVNAEVGQMTVPGNTVVTLARTDIREAVIDLPDPVVAQIAIGSRFNVALQADPRVTATGTVREIAPAADAVTRLRRVKVALESPPEAMRLGSTIRARPVGARSAGLIALPASALFRRGEEERVWIVGGEGPSVRSVAVRVVERDENTVRVAEGIAEGDRIVAAGANRLAEGQRVKGGENGR